MILRESRYSAKKSQGICCKPCASCGDDISHRHYITKYCTTCATKRINARHVVYMSGDKQQRHQSVRSITKKAVKVGFLPDPKTLVCADCGIPAQCYDHRDYNKPLDVAPVCRACNNKRGAGVALAGASSGNCTLEDVIAHFFDLAAA